MRRIPDWKRAMIARDYQACRSGPEVANRHGVSDVLVITIAREFGIPINEGARRYSVNRSFFQQIDTPLKSQILGFIFADGNVDQEEKRLTIALQRRDRSYLEQIAKALEYTGPIKDKDAWKGKTYCPQSELRVSSKEMMADLVRLGVVPAKSLIVVPWKPPQDLEAAFWLGWWEGDGWIDPPEGTTSGWYVGICGTLATVEAFLDFVKRRTGDVARAYIVSGSLWAVKFGSLPACQRVARLLHDAGTIFLERKRLLTQRLLAIKPRIYLTRDYTAEDFLQFKQEYGTWKAVAAHLGYCRKHLSQVLGDFGIVTLNDWSWLTKDYLLELWEENGKSWRKVEDFLGINGAHFWGIKRKLGIERTLRDWSYLTPDLLNEHFQKEGSWAGVARVLGMRKELIVVIRQRLGMPRASSHLRDWSWLTVDGLERLYHECGRQWKLVAKKIGMQQAQFVRKLDSLGVTLGRRGKQ
jgi:hypothetical protein